MEPSDTTTVAANVCALHRDAAIWGPDALAFRPGRFGSAMSREQKQAYMPFGLAKHLCPAYHGFGDRIILLLVTLLSEMLGPGRASVVYNDVRLDTDPEAELPTGRCDMEKWVLTLLVKD